MSNDFDPVTQEELQTETGKQKAFMQATLDLQGHAFSLGSSWDDSVNIVVLVRKKIDTFRTSSVADFVNDAKAAVTRQVDINNKFVHLWMHKQGLVSQGVRKGLGDLAKGGAFDSEALIAEAWAVILRKLLDGLYSYKGEKAENGWLREVGRNVARTAVSKHRNRLDLAINHPNFGRGMGNGGFARSHEDLQEACPDEKRTDRTVDED